MPERKEESVVKKSERAWDDFTSLVKRRPFLAFGIFLFLAGVPTVGWIVQGVWGNGKLRERLADTQDELRETKRERDVKATQLAPFLASAEMMFSNAPAGHRLNLLAERIAALERIQADTRPKTISQETISKARQELANLGIKGEFWVQPEFSDPESAALVRQFSHILLIFGGGSTGPPSTLPLDPVQGIKIEYSPALAPFAGGISNVFWPVCKELGRKLELAVHNDLAATNGIAVTVGTR